MAAKKKVTMQMIAAEIGVSIATVSHVFNHSRFVDPGLRKRILDCAETLGYIQKHSIQRKKSIPGAQIGLIISDIRDSDLFLDVIKISESIAGEQGYSLLVGDAENSAEKEVELVRNFMTRQVQGLLIASCLNSSAVLEKIRGFRKLPVVLIDRKWEENYYDFVGIDNYRASFNLTSQLIRQGFRRIGFLGLDRDTSTAREREHGCRVAMLTEHLSDSYSCCYLDLLGDLHQQVLNFCYDPKRKQAQYQAIVCFNTNVCCDLLSVLKAQRMSPEDFAIATYDDSPWLEFLTIPLTIVRQPATEISITAVKLLIEKIGLSQQHATEPAGKAQASIKTTEMGKEILLPVDIVLREVWGWSSTKGDL